MKAIRIPNATFTALFTMAVECVSKCEPIAFLRDAVGDNGQRTQESYKHYFDIGDVFLVTIFAQCRMNEHEFIENEKIGFFTHAKFAIEWEIASLSYKRHDGVVLIQPDQLHAFKFKRVLYGDQTPMQKSQHICGDVCANGYACKTRM